MPVSVLYEAVLGQVGGTQGGAGDRAVGALARDGNRCRLDGGDLHVISRSSRSFVVKIVEQYMKPIKTQTSPDSTPAQVTPLPVR